MIYHVLPGDAVAQEFAKGSFEGRPIVCRECLIVGPVDAPTREEFWNERSAFILAEYGEDEIGYHDTVARELERLADVDPSDEVNLWFEYELFCSVNMWFCLSLLAGSGAAIYRVEPIGLDKENRWDGFGRFSHDDLKKCFEARVRLAADDIKLGADLWSSFASRDIPNAKNIKRDSKPDPFPYLGEVLVAAANVDTEPKAIVREIMATGKKELSEIFPEFQSRAGVYGLGDLQIQSLIDRQS